MNTLSATATRNTTNWLERSCSAGEKTVYRPGRRCRGDSACRFRHGHACAGIAPEREPHHGHGQLLGWGSNGWLENILFCLNGRFLILFALRLYGAARNSCGKAGVSMLLLAGISFLTIALCPTLAPGAVTPLRSEIKRRPLHKNRFECRGFRVLTRPSVF